MGAISFSLDVKLLEFLQKHIKLDVFVETGTFEGNTVELAKKFFNEIYSIELSEHYYNLVNERFKGDDKIKLFMGSSAELFPRILQNIDNRSVVYWLDAHWCEAINTGGKKSQCPLLEELKAIKKLNDQSLIIIDDARLFVATPPEPHEINDWPHFGLILDEFNRISSNHYLSILNDTIIFYPKHLANELRFYEFKNGVDWLKISHSAEVFKKAADERLIVINALQQAANEHLVVINTLQQVADERLAIINRLQQPTIERKKWYQRCKNKA